MTFAEAVEKLRGMNSGGYKSLEYTYDFHSTGTEASECRIYDARTERKLYSGPSWESCFAQYEADIAPREANLSAAPGN